MRGLGNNTKRREIFNWLRSKKFSIYLLQEVHCSEKTSHLWSSEWGYQSLFTTFSSTKAGVGILFNNNFEIKIIKNFIDVEGRYIICDINANGKNITLINLYAPNEDDPTFFESLFEHVEDFQRDDVIIGGDFNLVLDIEKDKKGGTSKTHNNAKKKSCMRKQKTSIS